MPHNDNYQLTGTYHLPPGTNVMVGDVVTGPGVSAGTIVATVDYDKTAIGGPWNGYSDDSTYVQITLSSPIDVHHPSINNHNYDNIIGNFTGVQYGGWSSTYSFSRIEDILLPHPIAYLEGSTVSFKEDVKGWVSFKSFTPENAISCANEYYTFYKDGLWRHHDESVDMNTFYGVFKESSFTVILNNMPSSVKSFRTLNYEGSQARVLENLGDTGLTYSDGEYYNLVADDGWYVPSTETVVGAEGDLEKGGVSEFVGKEGKWFGYFTGRDANINESGLVIGGFNSADFSVQGIGIPSGSTTLSIPGCTDETMFNYNASATYDNGSCIAIVNGCIDANANNYDSLANTDNGTCQYSGCTDITAYNYDANANVDDGTCVAVIYGCIDVNAFNYSAAANTDNGTCVAVIYGCMDSTQFNYDPNANTSNNTCIAVVNGCMDSTMFNYNVLANTDDGTCVAVVNGCTDSLASNYDALANVEDDTCYYCVYGCMDSTAVNYDSTATCDDEDNPCTYVAVLGCIDGDASTNTGIACNYDASANTDDGSCVYCGDDTAVTSDHTDPACTDNCLYCTSPTGMVFTNITNAGFTIGWDQSYPTNDGATVSYTVIIGGVSYGSATSTNTTSWGGTSMTFDVDNQLPSTNYEVELTRTCGGTNMAGIIGDVETLAPDPILGCTDNTGTNTTLGATGMTPVNGVTWAACNYDAIATVDDGSCDYLVCAGCTNANYMEYDSGFSQPGQAAAVTAGYCTTLIVYGCTNPLYLEYDPIANTDDGSCLTNIVYGCFDDTLENDGDSAFINYGCSNPLSTISCVEVPAVNTDDGSCVPKNTCPTLTANIDAPGTGALIRVRAILADTIYSTGVDVNGLPDDIQMALSIKSYDASGSYTIIYSQAFSNGWVANNTTGAEAIEWDIPLLQHYQGQSSISVVVTAITTECTSNLPLSFNIGCNDINASNGGYYDINDESQCTYFGCTDATYAWDDSTRFATNYSQDSSGATRDISQIISCGGNNNCCQYTEPTMNFGYLLQGAPNASSWHKIGLYYNNENTRYEKVENISGQSLKVDGSVLIPPQSNSVETTLTTHAPWKTTDQNFYDHVGGNYIDIDQNLTNNYGAAGSSGGVLIQATSTLTATVDNASLNNKLDIIINRSYSVSIGCKFGNASHFNWDADFDLMQKDSCVQLGQAGCLDSFSSNYTGGNADCNGVYQPPGAVGADWCCWDVCAAPDWNNQCDPNDIVGGCEVTSIDVQTGNPQAPPFYVNILPDQSAYEYKIQLLIYGNLAIGGFPAIFTQTVLASILENNPLVNGRLQWAVDFGDWFPTTGYDASLMQDLTEAKIKVISKCVKSDGTQINTSGAIITLPFSNSSPS